MGLNAQGLGFLITAKDLASAVFDKVGGKLNQLSKKGADAGQGMQEMSGMLKIIGGGMIGIGVAGAAGMGLAFKESAKFEQSLAEIRTVVGEAQFPTEKLRKTLMGAAEEFGDPAPLQAASLYSILGAGITDAGKATDILRVSNKLAVGGFTQTSVATDALTSSMNAYRAQNLSATDAADALAKAVDIGKLRFEEIGPQIGRIAPSAAAAGISFDELAASIGAAAQVQKTEQAVEGLGSAIRGIVNPTKEAMDEAKRLGIEVGPDAIKTAGGLKQWFDKMSGSAKLNSGSLQKLISDSTGQTTANILLADSSAALTDALGQLANKSGTVNAKFKIADATFEHSAKKLKASLINAMITLGEAIAPVVGAMGMLIQKVVSGFNALPNPVKKAIAGFIVFASAAAIVIGGVVAFVGAVMGLLAAKALIVPALGAIAVALGAIAIVMLPLIALGGVLFALWTSNAGGFRDKVTAAFDAVSKAVEVLFSLLSSGTVSKELFADLQKASPGLADFAVQIYLWVNRIKNFFSGLGDGFSVAMLEAQPSIDAFMAAISKIGALFGLTKDAPDAARSKFEAFGSAGVKVGAMVGRGIELVVQGMTMVVRAVGVAIAIWNKLAPSVTLVKNAFVNVGTAVMAIIGAFMGANGEANSTASSFDAVGAAIGAMAAGAAQHVAMIANVFATIGQVLAGVIKSVRGAFTGIMGMWNGVINFFSAAVQGEWGGVWDAAKEIVFSFAKGVIEIMAGVIEGVAGAIDAMGAAVGKDFGMKAKVSGIKEGLVSGLQDSLGKQERVGVTTVEHVGRRAEDFLGLPSVGEPIGPAAPAAVAAAGGQAELVQAITAQGAKPPPPVNATYTTQLIVDGAQMAEVVQRHSSAGDARGFAPAPFRPGA